jgi:hypothetical protein
MLMTEEELQNILKAVLMDDPAVGDNPPAVADEHVVSEVRTFKEVDANIISKGLVVTTEDGSEFRITIVRSR